MIKKKKMQKSEAVKESIVLEAPDSESFENYYRNPIIAGRRKTYVNGLDIIYVFDKSQEAEDPLIPRAWIDANGKKYPLNWQGVNNALNHLDFVVKNKEDAIGVAKICVYDSYSGNSNIIGDDEGEIKMDRLRESHKGVDLPNVSKLNVREENGEYVVEFFVYKSYPESRMLNRGKMDESITKYVFMIREKIVNVDTEYSWGSLLLEVSNEKNKKTEMIGKVRLELNKDVDVFRGLSLRLDEVRIEESVGMNGKSDGQEINVRILIKEEGETKKWELSLPADYKRVIEKEPNSVEIKCGGHHFIIVEANLDSPNNPWVEIAVSSIL